MDKQFLVTSLYYFAIALLSMIFCYLAVPHAQYAKSNKNNIEFKLRSNNKINKILYIFSALIIIISLVFTDKGIDRPTYLMLFENVTLQQVLDYQNQEPGFMLINLILKLVFGKNKNIPFIFFYSLMVINVYYVIYKLRDNCNLPLSIFIFYILFCIQSINLMRIYVAGSILLVATYQLLVKHKAKSCFLWIFAVSIHYSSVLFILFYFVYAFYYCLRDKYKIKTIFLLILFAAMLLTIILLAPHLKNISVISRYKEYFDQISFGNIGLLQFLLYLPLIILSIYLIDIFGNNRQEYIYMANIIPCFLFGMISYMITILGRSTALFMYPFIIGVPYMYKFLSYRTRLCRYNNKLLYHKERVLTDQLIMLLLVMYVVFRFVLYMYQYIELDGIGIM